MVGTLNPYQTPKETEEPPPWRAWFEYWVWIILVVSIWVWMICLVGLLILMGVVLLFNTPF